MGAIRDLVGLARSRSESHPKRGYRFLADGVEVTESLAYSELDRDARRIAVGLKELGVPRGARAILLHPSGLEFVRAFWACFYAGVIAVPVPPPTSGRLPRVLARLRTIMRSCDADVLLTSSESEQAAREVVALAPELASKRIVTTDALAGDPDVWRPPSTSPDDVAVLQYTSGSTRDPRGVMITHANLLHNLDMLRTFHAGQEDMVMVSWLPLYHDMGLIRGMMSPLHMGGDCFLMSPLQFVQRPLKWLAAIAARRGTITGAPNFAFELCNRKISDADIDKLDLASLAIVFCTAEPIRKSTVEAFLARFARAGLRPGAFRPAYGLAEATVAVAGELTDGMRCFRVSTSALRRGEIVPGGEDPIDLVSCGTPLGDQEVLIVDEDRRPIAGGRIGEVWIRGPSVGRGYWANERDTSETFGGHLADGRGPYLRTGDLGCFTPDGGLVITGRRKDLIIVRGENYYPQDLEVCAERAAPALRPGCSVAFGIELEDGSDGVAFVAEYDGPADSPDRVVEAVRAAVSEQHEVALSAVYLIAPGTIPKTASGKVQRALTRELYLNGGLSPIHAFPRKRSAADELNWFLVRWLTARLCRRVALDADFASLGIDAVTADELSKAIADKLGVEARKLPVVSGSLASFAAAAAASAGAK